MTAPEDRFTVFGVLLQAQPSAKPLRDDAFNTRQLRKRGSYSTLTSTTILYAFPS